MKKTTDVEQPSRIHTRQTTRRMRESENPEAAGPQWRYPNSPTEARTLLVDRIERYLAAANSESLRDQWHSMTHQKKPSIPKILDFAVDTLQLQSVQRLEKYQNLPFAKRAKFFEPFSISMENVDISTSTEVVHENPASQIDEDPISVEEELLSFCIDSYDNVPPIYESEEIISQGVSKWITKVHHNSDPRLTGTGDAPNKLLSRELAAKSAIENLTRAVVNTDSESPAPLPQDIQHTDPSNSALVEVDEANDTYAETSFDSIPSGATPNLITAIHKHAMEKATEQFGALLRDAIDSMADLFDARIKIVLDETVENKLNSFTTTQVQQQVDQKTTRVIKNEIYLLVKTTVTESMKTNVINSVAETISKAANTECQQIFQNKLRVDIDKLTIRHKKEISETAENTLTLIGSAKADVMLQLTESADLNIKFVSRDKLELKANREQLKISIKTQFDNHVTYLQEETNEHISNLLEISESIKRTHVDSPFDQPMHQTLSDTVPTFVLHEDVTYKDTITGHDCQATIVDIHDDGLEGPFYTIKFATGKQRKVGVDNLIKLKSHKHSPIKSTPVSQPKADFNPSFKINIQPPPIPTPVNDFTLSSRPHEFHTENPGPDRLDVKSFLSHFQAKLRSHEDVLKFYNQSYSQSKHYNILLIDIKDIVPDIDLCPMTISELARTKMTTALYQKLQDDNTRDAAYHTLENCLQQYSTTSDGYKVLFELLRRVHPKLHDGNPIYTLPKLPDCDYNLYSLSRDMINYFEQERLRGRFYNEKEKAKFFCITLTMIVSKKPNTLVW